MTFLQGHSMRLAMENFKTHNMFLYDTLSHKHRINRDWKYSREIAVDLQVGLAMLLLVVDCGVSPPLDRCKTL